MHLPPMQVMDRCKLLQARLSDAEAQLAAGAAERSRTERLCGSVGELRAVVSALRRRLHEAGARHRQELATAAEDAAQEVRCLSGDPPVTPAAEEVAGAPASKRAPSGAQCLQAVQLRALLAARNQELAGLRSALSSCQPEVQVLVAEGLRPAELVAELLALRRAGPE